MFLQIFNMVVIVLVFLGCVLIYSLQLGDVQEKTYEYGMLRALGMRNHTLVVVLITQVCGHILIIFPKPVGTVLCCSRHCYGLGGLCCL